jgi:hypothetical protein
VLGVAALGTLYQALAPSTGIAPARTAFTVITGCFAVIALFGVLTARLSTRGAGRGSAQVRQHVPAEEYAGKAQEQHP